MAEFEQNSQDVVNNNDVTTNTSVDDTKKVEESFRTFKTQKEFDDFSAYLVKKGEEKALKNAKVKDGENTFDVKEYEKKLHSIKEKQKCCFRKQVLTKMKWMFILTLLMKIEKQVLVKFVEFVTLKQQN